MSEVTHKSLDEALLAFQADAPKLRTNDEAVVETKGGRTYKYKYLTLARLIDEVQPILVRHGLLWKAKPAGTHAEPTLRYSISHVDSHESDEGEMPLYLGGSPTAQAHGSSLSYARRYAQLTVLNLVAEDDDGKGASQDPPRVHRESRRTPPTPNGQGTHSDRPLTDAERERVEAAVSRDTRPDRLLLSAVGAGSFEELTAAQARQLKTILENGT